MSSREAIFSSIRSALEPLAQRAPAPTWDDELIRDAQNLEVTDLWVSFAKHLASVNGTPLMGLSALSKWLGEKGVKVGYCDPTLLDRIRGLDGMEGIELRSTFERTVVDEYEFGITVASGAIATTGSIVLKDKATSDRLAALAPWIHIAIITPDQLLSGLPAALAELGDDPSVIWATGPSKTADVEGILIEGAHGPGIQVVCLDTQL